MTSPASASQAKSRRGPLADFRPGLRYCRHLSCSGFRRQSGRRGFSWVRPPRRACKACYTSSWTGWRPDAPQDVRAWAGRECGALAEVVVADFECHWRAGRVPEEVSWHAIQSSRALRELLLRLKHRIVSSYGSDDPSSARLPMTPQVTSARVPYQPEHAAQSLQGSAWLFLRVASGFETASQASGRRKHTNPKHKRSRPSLTLRVGV